MESSLAAELYFHSIAHQKLNSYVSGSNYLTFGLPGWAEIMIGFAVGTPLQAMKLFFPFSCVKNILDITFESFDFYIFYDQMSLSTSNTDTSKKNLIFAIMSLLSIIIEFPQILSNCVPGQPQTDIGRLSQSFSDSILELLKTVIYADSAFNLLFQQQWFFSGYYGMYAILNLVSFVAFFALNS